MLKKLLLICLTGIALHGKSQGDSLRDAYIPVFAFARHMHIITAGYGFPNLYEFQIINALKSDNYSRPDQYSYTGRGTGPALIKYEYGLNNLISLGLSTSYVSADVTETYSYTKSFPSSGSYSNVTNRRSKSFSAALRINYHSNLTKKVETYCGFACGYSYKATKDFYSTTDPMINPHAAISYNRNDFAIAVTAGVRWYIIKNLGLSFEGGFEKWSVIQGGLAIKFE